MCAMTDNWINPEDRMPETAYYAHPIEITNSKGAKYSISGKWDDALSIWLDDEGEKLEIGTWKVTGWQPLPEPRGPKTQTWWVNIYQERPGSVMYPSREEADRVAAPTRIACVQFSEGEGL